MVSRFRHEHPQKRRGRTTGGVDLGIEHVWMHRSFGTASVTRTIVAAASRSVSIVASW